MSGNQPNLVNGFAGLLVKSNLEKAMITYDDYLEIEDLYVPKAIDRNTLNIVKKSNKCRILIERLLFTEAKIRFQIMREDIQTLYFEGIVSRDENGYVIFRVPLYQKCLHQAFYPYLDGEADHIWDEPI